MERIGLGKFGHVEIPEGCQSIIGIANEEETALQIRGNTDVLLNIITKVLISILSKDGSVWQASILASVVCYLKTHGVLADGVDMAVSLDGHVLPIDMIAAELFNNTKKDR